MKFSFIIIGRESSECEIALRSLRDLSIQDFEIILALGHNPSEQRNQAAVTANGEFLVFLDNDSSVHPQLLHYYLDALSYMPAIQIVGGPSVYRPQSSLLKKSFQAIFESAFGLGPFRSRYSSMGLVRRCRENELILCNLLINRKFFLSERGFNPDLYPNEENEFLNRVQARANAHHHPLAVCYRDPRDTLAQFGQQVFRYGMGRAKHVVRFPTIWNQIFLIPPVFALYFFSLLLMPFLSSPNSAWVIAIMPLAGYALLNFAASIAAAVSSRRVAMLATLPPLFFVCHFLYGLGFLSGSLIYRISRAPRPVGKIEVISLNDQRRSASA